MERVSAFVDLPALLVHACQLAFEHRRVGLHQALYTARSFRAGNRTDAGALANQRVVTDFALDQQQVAAVL